MKKIIFAMMLVTGISRQVIAQEKISSKTDKTFEVQSSLFSNRYSIDLGSGNRLQIELTEKNDINKLKNLDSILTVFFKDIVPFKDSFTDELAAKRIDYVMDEAGRKKIRIQIFKSPAASFVIRQGEVAALKTEQDTVNIIGIVAAPTKYGLHKALSNVRYYRLSFYMNDFNELKNTDLKTVSKKIEILKSNKRWIKDKEGEWHMKNGDNSISTTTPYGTTYQNGDYIQSNLSTSIQNYKNNFVPSISLGFDLVFNNGINKKYFGLALENHFFFAKDINGKVKTFQNNFLTLSYKQTYFNEKNTAIFHFSPDLSLSYLVKRRGEFYDKNTFRLGLGKINMYKETVSLEPSLYFNNLFKNITPGLRLSVGF